MILQYKKNIKNLNIILSKVKNDPKSNLFKPEKLT